MGISTTKPNNEELIIILTQKYRDIDAAIYSAGYYHQWWKDIVRVVDFNDHQWKSLSVGGVVIPIRCAECGLYIFEFVASVLPTAGPRDFYFPKCNECVVKDIIK